MVVFTLVLFGCGCLWLSLCFVVVSLSCLWLCPSLLFVVVHSCFMVVSLMFVVVILLFVCGCVSLLFVHLADVDHQTRFGIPVEISNEIDFFLNVCSCFLTLH